MCERCMVCVRGVWCVREVYGGVLNSQSVKSCDVM